MTRICFIIAAFYFLCGCSSQMALSDEIFAKIFYAEISKDCDEKQKVVWEIKDNDPSLFHKNLKIRYMRWDCGKHHEYLWLRPYGSKVSDILGHDSDSKGMSDYFQRTKEPRIIVALESGEMSEELRKETLKLLAEANPCKPVEVIFFKEKYCNLEFVAKLKKEMGLK